MADGGAKRRRTARALGELALEAGVPPGVLNIVIGKGRVVGDALVAHPGVDKVTFTGSRILAHRDVYDEAVERVAARAKSIKVGDPSARETSMGATHFRGADEDGAGLRRHRTVRRRIARDRRRAGG